MSLLYKAHHFITSKTSNFPLSCNLPPVFHASQEEPLILPHFLCPISPVTHSPSIFSCSWVGRCGWLVTSLTVGRRRRGDVSLDRAQSPPISRPRVARRPTSAHRPATSMQLSRREIAPGSWWRRFRPVSLSVTRWALSRQLEFTLQEIKASTLTDGWAGPNMLISLQPMTNDNRNKVLILSWYTYCFVCFCCLMKLWRNKKIIIIIVGVLLNTTPISIVQSK